MDFWREEIAKRFPEGDDPRLVTLGLERAVCARIASLVAANDLTTEQLVQQLRTRRLRP